MRWLVALLLLSGIAFAQSQQPSPSVGEVRQPDQSQTNTAQQPSATDQRGTEKMPLIVKTFPAPKTEEETARETKEREDKAALDRKLVDFNGDLVIASAVLAIIGFFQLIVFGLQARRLRQTVKAASDQSDNMQKYIVETARAANAMERVAASLRENAARQLRAYISILPGAVIEQDRNTDIKYEIQPVVRNGGFTPASNVIIYSKVDILPDPLPVNFNFVLPLFQEPSISTLGFQQTNFSIAYLTKLLSDSEIAEIKKPGGRRLYVYGNVTYDDIFGSHWNTNFCFYIIWGSKGPLWLTTKRHNDAT